MVEGREDGKGPFSRVANVQWIVVGQPDSWDKAMRRLALLGQGQDHRHFQHRVPGQCTLPLMGSDRSESWAYFLSTFFFSLLQAKGYFKGECAAGRERDVLVGCAAVGRKNPSSSAPIPFHFIVVTQARAAVRAAVCLQSFFTVVKVSVNVDRQHGPMYIVRYAARHPTCIRDGGGVRLPMLALAFPVLWRF
jgi:hypothetical protein